MEDLKGFIKVLAYLWVNWGLTAQIMIELKLNGKAVL